MNYIAMVVLATVLQVVAAAQVSSLAGDAQQLAAAATNEARFDVLTGLLKARGIPFTVEPFTIEKPLGREPRTEGRNIVVTLGSGSEDVVVGAHYDAARLPDGSLSKGAVDNAASSVILVRLADTLRTETFGVRLRIVWFDMEELGLIGSQRYLGQHGSKGIAAMLNFDINGYGDTIVFGPAELKENAALRRKFVESCAAEDISCVGFVQMPPGDDRPFTKAGVPTISSGIVPAVEVHQLWLLLQGGAKSGLAPGVSPEIMRTIHTPADTPDKLNEDTMARIHRFATTLVRSVAKK